jgi:hypothetical protein
MKRSLFKKQSPDPAVLLDQLTPKFDASANPTADSGPNMADRPDVFLVLAAEAMLYPSIRDPP